MVHVQQLKVLSHSSFWLCLSAVKTCTCSALFPLCFYGEHCRLQDGSVLLRRWNSQTVFSVPFKGDEGWRECYLYFSVALSFQNTLALQRCGLACEIHSSLQVSSAFPGCIRGLFLELALVLSASFDFRWISNMVSFYQKYTERMISEPHVANQGRLANFHLEYVQMPVTSL